MTGSVSSIVRRTSAEWVQAERTSFRAGLRKGAGVSGAFLTLDRLGELDEAELERRGDPTDRDPCRTCLPTLDPYIGARRQSSIVRDFFL